MCGICSDRCVASGSEARLAAGLPFAASRWLQERCRSSELTPDADGTKTWNGARDCGGSTKGDGRSGGFGTSEN
jgi:hypothetical protein